jgi:hypothetical protein
MMTKSLSIDDVYQSLLTYANYISSSTLGGGSTGPPPHHIERQKMREIFLWGIVLFIAGACCGLIWPFMLIGAIAMSVAFVSVYLYFFLKGNR